MNNNNNNISTIIVQPQDDNVLSNNDIYHSNIYMYKPPNDIPNLHTLYFNMFRGDLFDEFSNIYFYEFNIEDNGGPINM